MQQLVMLMLSAILLVTSLGCGYKEKQAAQEAQVQAQQAELERQRREIQRLKQQPQY